MPDASKANAADEALIRALQRQVPKSPPADQAKWNPKTKAANTKPQRGGKK